MAKFISLFAGVGGFDLGMEQAGHECVAQVEWDKNAAGVLKHRWPNVPLFCDVSKVSADDLPDADLAMGNAVTVNVAEWIGKQIGKVLS